MSTPPEAKLAPSSACGNLHPLEPCVGLELGEDAAHADDGQVDEGGEVLVANPARSAVCLEAVHLRHDDPLHDGELFCRPQPARDINGLLIGCWHLRCVFTANC